MENKTLSIYIGKEIATSGGRLTLEVKTSVTPGELVALFGPSGAGKTTLLRMLAGLTSPDWGEIRFGDDIWFDAAKGIFMPPQKRNIGFMFQDYALFPNMTVRENILYAQSAHDHGRVDCLINSFGLGEFVNRRPSKLSGGQKQRVALARALAREPKLLLLDEPLSALDAGLRSSLQKEIRKTHLQFKTTTLMVSHDLAEVFRLADTVVCLEHGKVTRTGKPAEVFADNSISGKVQITGQLVNIEPKDNFYLLTVVTGANQIIKVIAFENDIVDLRAGDQVLVFTKAFNPMITKLR